VSVLCSKMKALLFFCTLFFYTFCTIKSGTNIFHIKLYYNEDNNKKLIQTPNIEQHCSIPHLKYSLKNTPLEAGHQNQLERNQCITKVSKRHLCCKRVLMVVSFTSLSVPLLHKGEKNINL